MNHPTSKGLVLLMCILFCFLGAFANNGYITYAYPMKAITVDGDLSDWPIEVPYLPINKYLFGEEPSSPEDIHSKIRLGYNLETQMLYVAVETIDDITVRDDSDTAEWNTHDMHNLYMDLTHSIRGSGSISHLVSPDYNRIAENKPEAAWDPQVKNSTWDPVKVIIRQEGNLTIYEWSYFLGDQLVPGRSIGFDYEVLDRDPDEGYFPTTYLLTPRGRKAFNCYGMGDLIFVENKAPLATLSGTLKWEEGIERIIPNQINISSISRPDLWVVTQVDSLGNYEVDLPAGSYEITLPWTVFNYGPGEWVRMNVEEKIMVELGPGQVKQVEDFVMKESPKPEIPSKGLLADFVPENEKEVDQFMKTFMSFYDVPGASIVLVKDAQVVYHQTYGYKNAFTQEKVNDKTLFEAASITKPIFAFAVNRLVERGEFDLNKPLHEYLPFPDIAGDERYLRMTGKHVLEHTSGLPNWERRMIEEPGTKYGYSGEGFEYLKRVVAHVTQRDIEELVKEEVLDVMGMSQTYFSHKDELVPLVAHGHYNDKPNLIQIPQEPGMAHSMHTEALGFAPFMIGLLERKGLQPETYDKMLTAYTDFPKEYYTPGLSTKESFGLGIMVMETPWGMAYGHGGNNGDFRCQFEIFDEGKMGFAIYTNGSEGHHLSNDFREFLIMGKVDEAKKLSQGK